MSETKPDDPNVSVTDAAKPEASEPAQLVDGDVQPSTAEPSKEPALENAASGSWWSSGLKPDAWSGWLENAKQKSAEAIEFMKKDLTEIKDTVQTESMPYLNQTSTALKASASYIKDTMNSLVDEEDDPDVESENQTESTQEPSSQTGLSNESIAVKATEKIASVFTSLVDALSPQGFDDDDDVILSVDDSEADVIPRDRWDTLVQAIQSDPETYKHEPSADSSEYEAWLAKFSLTDIAARVERILATVPEVRQFYEQFVPSELTHERFWLRYFFRVEQLRQVELKRIAAKRPPVELSNTEKSTKEDQVAEKPSHPSPVNSDDSSKSHGTSDEWEKAELTDIVDEAAKKLADKLNAMPSLSDGPKSDEEINDWEFD
ncbi:BSD domain-containing protein 1 [Halotydeus destructor]|nr:BSD domain-containing protein 1 [Halotydeus destructor]